MDIVLIEDNIVQQDLIEIYINDCGYKLMAKFTSAEEAETEILTLKPDLLLVDINLEGRKNGIMLAEEMTKKYQIPIIFITSQTSINTIKNAAENKPLDILIKPLQFEQFKASLVLAQSKQNPKTSSEPSKFVIKKEHLILKKGHLFERHFLTNLIYIEGMGNYFNLYFEDEKVTIKGTLSEIESALPIHNFARVNRSIIISLNHVKSFNTKRVFMNNGKEFAISKNTSDELMNKLMG